MKNEKELLQIFNRHLENEFLCYTTPTELYQPVKYILSIGGKRLRPILVLMACNLFSNNIEKAIPAAIAIETFHNFTLLHDDIMDNSSMRRNQPTVHVRWNVNTAILSGDAMSIIAYQILAKSETVFLKEILDLFSQTALEICEGQQYDMNFENITSVTEEQYVEMIRLKTSVLLATSLKMGAIIGGASKTDADLLYNFGLNIGLAFQLQDDYLDVYGNPESFGKKIGNDIVSNKKTFLLTKSIELAQGSIAHKLQFWLTSEQFNKTEKIENITNIYNTLGIDKLTKTKIFNYYTKARTFLQEVQISDENKSVLLQFTNNLMMREK